MKEWWYHISRYHIIDQLALPYVLKKSDCKYNIIDEKYGEIPYLTYTRKRDMESLNYILRKYKIETLPKHNSPVVLPITRDDLAELFAELEFNKGVEIGVDQGLYSEILCKANPNLVLHGIDPWKAYRGYTDYTSQTHIDANRADALKRLAPYNVLLVEKFSMEAVKDYPDQSLDFVYIDGNHEFLHVAEDIAHWVKKVRRGGILAGHDYRRTSNNWVCHVVDVVNAWTYAHKIKPWFLTGNDIPSWFWVKA
jgi:hypothetical protein